MIILEGGGYRWRVFRSGSRWKIQTTDVTQKIVASVRSFAAANRYMEKLNAR